MLGCVPVALVPLLYDGNAVADGYIGEVIVVCLAYVILGLLIIRARSCSWSCASRREALALLDPLTELPNRRAMIDWLTAATGSASRPPACSSWTWTASRT